MKIKITKKEINKFLKNYSEHDNEKNYKQFLDINYLRVSLLEIVNQKCPNNKEIKRSIRFGIIRSLLEDLSTMFAHINYKYDALTALLLHEISRIEKQNFKFYQISNLVVIRNFNNIKINVDNIPHSKRRIHYLFMFNEFNDELYKNFKENCRLVTRNDINPIVKELRNQYIKKIRNHPYVSNYWKIMFPEYFPDY